MRQLDVVTMPVVNENRHLEGLITNSDIAYSYMDILDNRILSTIIHKFNGGPVGLGTVATAVSEDAGTIEEVYEPFLIKEGFLKRTPRGREATPLAYEHLGIALPGGIHRQGELEF